MSCARISAGSSSTDCPTAAIYACAPTEKTSSKNELGDRSAEDRLQTLGELVEQRVTTCTRDVDALAFGDVHAHVEVVLDLGLGPARAEHHPMRSQIERDHIAFGKRDRGHAVFGSLLCG